MYINVFTLFFVYVYFVWLQSRWDNVRVAEPQQWMNINELCDYLPDRPSKKTIYKWVSTRTIPYNKGSKALRFSKSDIDQWLAQDKHETAQEILAQMNNETYLPIKRKGGAIA